MLKSAPLTLIINYEEHDTLYLFFIVHWPSKYINHSSPWKVKGKVDSTGESVCVVAEEVEVVMEHLRHNSEKNKNNLIPSPKF